MSPHLQSGRRFRADTLLGLITCVLLFQAMGCRRTVSTASTPVVESAADGTDAAETLRRVHVEKSIVNNLRQLYGAANQYYLEMGVTTAELNDLVGPESYKSIKEIIPLVGERYPDRYTQGVTLTVLGVEGARTITYAP